MSEPITAGLDPIAYMRLPKLDVATALGVEKILLHRVPNGSPPAVRTAASAIEHAIAELATKWRQQRVPSPRIDTRPLARRLCAAWKAIRDRLASYAAYPDDSDERTRADEILDRVLPDGLAFLLLSAARQHAHSERRIATIDERGLAKDLERLVGSGFLAILRAAHRAYGDALGISKAVPQRPAPVLVAPQLRALTDAISAYTLQLLALAGQDSEQHRAVASALAPIDELRASIGRRVVVDDATHELPIANAPPEPQLRRTGSG